MCSLVHSRPQPVAAAVTTAGALIQRLEAHGVGHVFGIPGTHILPLYRELASSSIRHVTPRHEQGAGYAADGYARASGRPGVCVVTTGPGVLNVATAAAQAHSDSIPILVISSGVPKSIDGRDTGFLHEVKDQRGAMARIVARSQLATSPLSAVRAIDRAFADFTAGRPRPVHIDIPLDLLDRSEPLDAPAQMVAARPELDLRLVDLAASMLANARSPALVVGGGAVTAGIPVRALAQALQAPVVTTINGKGVLPEDDPLSLGASLRLDASKRLLRGSDVVLAVGTELAESDLWQTPPLPLEGKLIRVDLHPAQGQKNASPEVVIVGDAGEVLAAIVTALPRATRKTPDLSAARQAIRAEALRDGNRFAPLVAALRRALPQDSIIAGDTAQVCYYGIAHFFPVRGPRQFLYPTGLGTLGYGVPAAIGAKVALPHRPVVAVVGDGGLMFTLAELAAAVEQRLSVPIVVVNDGGYGAIRHQMAERGIPAIGVDLHTPDLPALAEAFGARGARAETPDELTPLMRAALERDGPTLIEVPG